MVPERLLARNEYVVVNVAHVAGERLGINLTTRPPKTVTILNVATESKNETVLRNLLQEGDQIVSVNGTPATDATKVSEQIMSSRQLSFCILRNKS